MLCYGSEKESLSLLVALLLRFELSNPIIWVNMAILSFLSRASRTYKGYPKLLVLCTLSLRFLFPLTYFLSHSALLD